MAGSGERIWNLSFPPTPIWAVPNLPVDGELAGDIMQRYDTEMDFAGGKLSYFLPDHCDGHVVHWTTAPASVVPFRRTKRGERNPTNRISAFM